MFDTKPIADLLKGAAAASGTPGVVAAAATRDDVFFEGAYGARDLDAGIPMTVDTVFRIASMTKAITAACVMQLVERAKLSLDEPAGQFAPELFQLKVLEGYDREGAPLLRSPKRPITLRHLMTHTAGFVYDIWNGDLAEYRQRTNLPGLASGLNASLSTPLFFDPGERWEYGIGMAWAGKVVEGCSGLRLGEYMKANIFGPLGMADSGFRLTAAQRSRLAQPYMRSPDGLIRPLSIEGPEPEFDNGGEGLYSTMRDYLTFTRTILRGGNFGSQRLLSPETVALMGLPAMGDLRVTTLKTAAPQFTNDVTFIDGMQWGLSFLINPETTPQGRAAGSLAWAGGLNSYYWIDPHTGITGVYATQILPFCDGPSLDLFQRFEAAVYRGFR
jgi:methyl acetate hydrolase